MQMQAVQDTKDLEGVNMVQKRSEGGIRLEKQKNEDIGALKSAFGNNIY
jgi:hypothetical protein